MQVRTALCEIQLNMCKTATQKENEDILMTNGSLMKVKSIAECSNTFDLHYAIIGLQKQFLALFRVAVLHRFYCTCTLMTKTYFRAP